MDRTRPQPPVPLRRETALAVGLALLGASVTGAGLTLHSRAGDDSARAGAAAGPSRLGQRWGASGHVDVDSGVAGLYPLQPGLVVRIPVRENQEVEAGAPLIVLDNTMAREQ